MKVHRSMSESATRRPPLSEKQLEMIAGSNLVMARYYFNIRHSDGLIEDQEGQELRSLEEARAEAAASARELIAESVLRGQGLDHRTFEINDESGSTLAVVPFAEAIRKSTN
jgi:hypothetical protein